MSPSFNLVDQEVNLPEKRCPRRLKSPEKRRPRRLIWLTGRSTFRKNDVPVVSCPQITSKNEK